MIQDVFIIGATGGVGKTLVKQIFEKGDTDPNLHKNPTRVIGLASSSSFAHDPYGLSERKRDEFYSRSCGSNYSLNDLLKAVSKEGRDSNLSFVDVTSVGQEMVDFHRSVINETPYGIVTANKNPLTMVNYDDFVELARHHKRYGFRCSVMAGANAIDEIKDLVDLGDPVRSIRGCFSGTLGYICSQLQTQMPFSEIVREARELGYTEPHPAEDLSGRDVAKKLLILARTAGVQVDMDQIPLIPLIPQEFLEEEDVDVFMDGLKPLDREFLSRKEELEANGKVIRYPAELSLCGATPYMRVGPTIESKDSPLGMLAGRANKIVIQTDTHDSDTPCIIEAPGAGLEVTAQNVRRDLMRQIRERTVSYRNGNGSA
ncbi:hypothetical protein CMI41_03350 [Candidatus Pacearchaeota archaeon]|nr:hypothetical protein [Candidatus Pacearchaeota archaeon]|tara:strand:- start:5203 stop:6321 length:1119 start_codon:yes stop_codon:yes gene_type:complete